MTDTTPIDFTTYFSITTPWFWLTWTNWGVTFMLGTWLYYRLHSASEIKLGAPSGAYWRFEGW